jgi:hypothetical protein
MSRMIAIQFKTVISQTYTHDLFFSIDGRWAPRTVRANMLDAVREHKAKRAPHEEPIEPIGYHILGVGDYSGNLHPMPFVPSNTHEWRVTAGREPGTPILVLAHRPFSNTEAPHTYISVGGDDPQQFELRTRQTDNGTRWTAEAWAKDGSYMAASANTWALRHALGDLFDALA